MEEEKFVFFDKILELQTLIKKEACLKQLCKFFIIYIIFVFKT